MQKKIWISGFLFGWSAITLLAAPSVSEQAALKRASKNARVNTVVATSPVPVASPLPVVPASAVAQAPVVLDPFTLLQQRVEQHTAQIQELRDLFEVQDRRIISLEKRLANEPSRSGRVVVRPSYIRNTRVVR